MLVSFIIPTYNQVEFLNTALDSISAQELNQGSFEVLVFDGGSTDGTVDVLSSHSLVDHFSSCVDKGQSDAINEGFKQARGEIIAWLNSDDAYLPRAIHSVIEVFNKRPEVDLVYGHSIDIDVYGNRIGYTEVLPWSKEALTDSCIISQPACFFRQSFIERNGLLREDLHLTMDYEYWLRASGWANFFYLPQPLALNRVHPRAKSFLLSVEQIKESINVVYSDSGNWSRKWLRRLASARARQLLKLSKDQDSRFRYFLSALLFVMYNTRVKFGFGPFADFK